MIHKRRGIKIEGTTKEATKEAAKDIKKWILAVFILLLSVFLLLPKQLVRAEATSLPVEYNSNAAGEVPIRDQGSYGTCWTFGAVATLEMMLYHTTGQVYDFSEAYLLNTLKQQFQNNDGTIINPDGLSHFDLNSGGDMYDALIAMVSSPYGGIVLEEEAPYEGLKPESATDDSLYISPIKKQEYSLRTSITEYFLLQEQVDPTQDKKAYETECIRRMKEAILEYGAVVAAMHHNVDAIDSKGICSDEGLQLMPNHAICIVGWKQIDNEEYWIVKDSHGVEAGDEGYIYMKLSASHMTYSSNIWVIRSAKVSDQAQSYIKYQEVDNFRGGAIFSREGEAVMQMQMFETATEKELLDYVYFYTRVAKGTCEVYLDMDGVNIEKAGRAEYDLSKATKLGTVNLSHAGAYTIPANNIALGDIAGQPFLLILKTVPSKSGLINKGSVDYQSESIYYQNGNPIPGKGLWAPIGCITKTEAGSPLSIDLLPELSVRAGSTESSKQATIYVAASDVSGISNIMVQQGNITSSKDAAWKEASKLTDTSMFTVRENGWYSIMATDHFGNSRIQSLYIDHIDTTAPKAPKVQAKSGTKKVSGTGEAGSTVYVMLQGVMHRQTVKEDGTFSITVSKLSKGNVIVIFSVDKAGNSSPMTVVKVK